MQSFYKLDPERVLHAAEEAGFLPTGEFNQLNSYENRVFDLRIELPLASSGSTLPLPSPFNPFSTTPLSPSPNADREIFTNVIAKFYRPGRWSKEAIAEEHDFLLSLATEEIPVVAPLVFQDNPLTQRVPTRSLFEFDGMYVAFFDKMRGRMPQELFLPDYFSIGVLLGKIHNVGADHRAKQRPTMDSSFHGGWKNLEFLQNWIAPEIRDRYLNAAETILLAMDEQIDPHAFIRIHGDCHRGNLIHNTKEFFLIDFDDFCNGPVIQDFWMLLSDLDRPDHPEREQLIEGYEQIRELPRIQWDWIPILRGLRVMSYAGWIAKRWEDPSFPRLFPEFNTYRYWAEETEALEQIAWQL